MTDGTLERRGEHQVIRFERRIAHPVERVWRALTEPDQIAAWLALAELDLEEGGRVVLTWQNTDDEGNTSVARGTVSALEPPRLLETSFQSGKNCTVTYELFPDGERTRLVLTHSGFESGTGAQDFGSGWNSHLTVLQERLAGRSIRDFWALHAQSRDTVAKALG